MRSLYSVICLSPSSSCGNCFLLSGCGSSCVFALLGHTLNNWRFICTEIDKTNLTYSRENVKRNNLTEKVTGMYHFIEKTEDVGGGGSTARASVWSILSHFGAASSSIFVLAQKKEGEQLFHRMRIFISCFLNFDNLRIKIFHSP